MITLEQHSRVTFTMHRDSHLW